MACEGAITDGSTGDPSSAPENISPIAVFSIDTSEGNADLTVNFDAANSTDTDGTISTYAWDYGDSTTGTALTSSHTYTASGIFLAVLTVTDNQGASNISETQLIRVLAANTDPTAALTSDIVSGAAELNVSFDASTSSDSDGSILYYFWDFGDGSTGTGQTISHLYVAAGTYAARVTVTDDSGAQNISDPRAISVLPANAPPNAAFSSDISSGNTPLIVNFDASSSSDSNGSIATYNWNFGDGTTGTGQTVSHTYTRSGAFLAFLTVTDNDGASNVATGQVLQSLPVSSTPTARFTTAASALNVNFDASSSSDANGNIVTYNWDFGDGTTGSGAALTHSYATAGTYSVTLTVTDNDAQQNASNAQLITVVSGNAPPVAAFSLDKNSGALPLTINFDASTSSDSDGSIASYLWTFGDGTSGSGASINHTYINAGFFSAYLTVTDNSGASNSSSTQLITLQAGNVPPQSAFNVNLDSGPAKLTVNFDALASSDIDGSITYYFWNFGDGTAAVGPQTSHTYRRSGSYSATVTTTDNEGAQSTSSPRIISVSALNTPPTAAFTSDILSGDSPLSVSFDATTSSDSNGSIATYAWDFGDGNRDTGVAVNHTYTQAGTYLSFLTVTDNQGASNTVSSQSIRVYPGNSPPNAAFTLNNNQLTVDFNASTSADSDGSIIFYSWRFGDGNTDVGQQVSHTYSSAGTYIASLTVTDDLGAEGSNSISLTTVTAGNSPPAAAFSMDTSTGRSPQAVNFDAVASSDSDGTITAYAWDFGDGATGSGETISHTYSRAGSFLAFVSVTDNAGARSNSSAQLIRILAANIAPIASFSSNVNSGPAALSVNFNASTAFDADGSIVNYVWDFGDGKTGSGVQPINVYSTLGSYSVSLTVTDNNSAQTTSSIQVINVSAANTLPVPSFSMDVSSGENPLTVNFNGAASSDSDGSISAYTWDFGDGNTGTGQTANYIYTVNGTYPATLTVTDNDGGNTTSSSQLVRVLPQNISPTAIFTVNRNSLPTDVNVDFNASLSSDIDGSIVSYAWDFGDSTTGIGQTPSHRYSTQGSYAVSLTVTDDKGALNTSNAQVITVNIANVVPIANFSVDTNRGENPLTVNFDGSASTDSDGTIDLYSWNFGDGNSDGNSASGATASYTYTTEGVFLAQLTVTDNDGSAITSASQTIRVLPANVSPSAAFTADTSSGQATLVVNFNASTSVDTDGSITLYAWDFGDGTTGAGQTPSHSYSTAGSYSVILVVTDDAGAEDTSSTLLISVAVANVAPSASFSVDSNSGGNPLTVNFDASASADSDGSIASYAWNLGDGSTATGVTASYTYAAEGNYVVFVSVTDDSGSTTTSATQTISVLPPNAPPTASFTTDTVAGAPPLIVNFDASGSSDIDGSITAYAWDFGDGNSAVGQLVSNLYSVAGDYTARLQVTDNDGASQISTVLISAQLPVTSPTARFSVDTTNGEVPLSVNFDGTASTDPNGSIASYNWDFGDGNSATGITTSYQYTAVGSYQATLTVTDNDGETNLSAAQTIDVLSVNALPTALFSMNASSGTTPLTVSFDATTSADSDGSIVSYEWDFGDGFKAAGAQTSHTYYADGSHSASLTVTDDRGGQTTSSPQTIAVASNGGVNISGSISYYSFISNVVDSDINDLGANYIRNNTTASAQLLASSTDLDVWGFVSKTATGVIGQRFANRADEVDFYRTTLPLGQTITLNTRTENVDFDLYLYAVNDTQNPVASALGTSSYESLTVPAGGDYFIVVSAFSGTGTYRLSTELASTALNNKQSLSLNSDFNHGQMISKLKPSIANPLVLNRQQAKNQVMLAVSSLSSQHDIHLLHGHTSRASLYAMNTPVNTGATISTDSADNLFDGRYGIGLSDKNRQAYNTLKTIKRLRIDSRVQYAEPNYQLQANFTPNDPLYPNQWHYPAINLPQAWDITRGSASVIVAVIDSGVFLAHEDLSGNLLSTGYDFISDATRSNDGDGIDADPDDPGNADVSTSVWHGTHVSGTIAASSDNNIGVAGVAHDIRIMPIRALGEGGSGSSYDIAQGVLYAAGLSNDSNTLPAQKADIINMSLGGSYPNQSMIDAVKLAQNAGVIIIASAGNSNTSSPSYPASYSGVISVGAVGQGNERSSYSNFGPNIDLVAPGGDNKIDANNDGKNDSTVLSSLVDSSSGSRQPAYAQYQGTSMSSPHVAGVVALMKSLYAELSPNLLNALIQAGSITTDLNGDGASTRNDTYGYGMIDALKAVQQAQGIANGSIVAPLYNSIDLVSQIDNMVSSNQQNISINQFASSLSVTAISLDLAWASLAPLGTDADGNGVNDGDGMGNYQLTIDRTGLASGLYLLNVSFTLDDASQHTKIINITVSAGSTSITYANAYIALIDSSTRSIVYQQQLNISSTSSSYTLNNIPDGSYFLYAGTDFNGNKRLDPDVELVDAVGSSDTPSIITVSGSDVNASSMSLVYFYSFTPVVLDN